MKNLYTPLLCLLILLLGVHAIEQTFVSTSPENKNVVLEEFTGIHCTYCPDGHRLAQILKDANPNASQAIMYQGHCPK